MKKIIIIGCPGSGKSTFAKKLSEKLCLPLFHLDAIWHRPDRTHIPREVFDTRLDEILSLDLWIIDGHYRRTLARRLEVCDTVFFFDLPTEDCVAGAMARLGTKREDLPFLESEIDTDFKQRIESFSQQQLPEVYALLEGYRDKKRVVVFSSREEADEFLRQMP